MLLEDVRQLTVEEFHRMGELGIIAPGERVELIEGVMRKMAPIGAIHSWTVNRLAELFILALHNRFTVAIQNPIRLSDDTEPEPDVSILTRLRPGEAPRIPHAEDVHLVAEVRDRTLSYDRKVKVPLYASAGIPEVWVVDTVGHAIEQYLTPEEGAYQVVRKWRKGERIPCSLGVEFAVDEILV